MIYYVIMHKDTGFLMPLGARNRGYSHWNPATQTSNREDFTGKMVNSLQIPRLLDSYKQANRCIAMWAANPNATVYHDHDGDSDISVENDGRKKEDLVVIEVWIDRLPKEARIQ